MVLNSSMLLLFNGCKEKAQQFDEYVYATQLVDDTGKIEEYLEYHKEVWPEVEEGFRKAGYHSIKLYRFNNHLMMRIEVPKGSDLEEMGATKELHTDRVKEWNTLMSSYQRGLPGTAEDTTWVPMQQFYEFKKGN